MTVEKLLSTTENSFAVTSVQGPIDPKKGIKGPLVLGAAGTYNTGKTGSHRPLRGLRLLAMGRQ